MTTIRRLAIIEYSQSCSNRNLGISDTIVKQLDVEVGACGRESDSETMDLSCL